MKGTCIQFIVPTWKRVDYLRLCLESVLHQSVKANRIFVGVRADDAESLALVDDYIAKKPVTQVEARGVGVIGSMSACLNETDGDYIALLDDDVELPPHWLETMLSHLKAHPDVVGCAGRDLLQDHPEMRRAEPLTMDVGRICWYGRITGNHHRGGGSPRKVQVLRGSNILFRGEFLREAGFEQNLRGQGAQVNWELALAFQAAAQGKALFYDPSVGVIHHTAPRHDLDLVHRGGFNYEGILDMSFNETLVALKHAPCKMKPLVVCWQFLVGSRTTPGLLNVLRKVVGGDSNTWASLKGTMTGRWRACAKTMAVCPA